MREYRLIIHMFDDRFTLVTDGDHGNWVEVADIEQKRKIVLSLLKLCKTKDMLMQLFVNMKNMMLRKYCPQQSLSQYYAELFDSEVKLTCIPESNLRKLIKECISEEDGTWLDVCYLSMVRALGKYRATTQCAVYCPSADTLYSFAVRYIKE